MSGYLRSFIFSELKDFLKVITRKKVLKICLVATLFIIGCYDFSPKIIKTSNLKLDLLTNDSVKYWRNINISSDNSEKESGFALYKNGFLQYYQYDSNNLRIAVDIGSIDVLCDKPKYRKNNDTLFLKRCGWIFIFKIVKLTCDTLQLNELTQYGYFPDSVPIFLFNL